MSTEIPYQEPGARSQKSEADSKTTTPNIQNPTSKIFPSSNASEGTPAPLSFTTSNLSKRFNREWIFRGLNFSFEPGNTYAITGPNGSGKSTLLQVLWGQMPPSAGDVQYKKGDASIPPEEVFHHLSIATPYMDLVEEFTLYEQLKFHFSLKKAAGV